MNTLSGLGKLDRERMTTILRDTQHTISVVEAAKILGMSKEDVAKLLSRGQLRVGFCGLNKVFMNQF
jgi:transcriptional regulator with GAF, ATPase, and Fis domain